MQGHGHLVRLFRFLPLHLVPLRIHGFLVAGSKVRLNALILLFALLKDNLLPLLIFQVDKIVPGAARMNRQNQLALLEAPEVRFFQDQLLESLIRDVLEEGVEFQL